MNEQVLSEVVILFKVKKIEEDLSKTLFSLLKLKSKKENYETYRRCITLYREMHFNLSQCIGFIKAVYLQGPITPKSRNFLLNNLYIPSYKKFKSLRENLSILDVEELYKESLNNLKNQFERIYLSMSEVLTDLKDF